MIFLHLLQMQEMIMMQNGIKAHGDLVLIMLQMKICSFIPRCNWLKGPGGFGDNVDRGDGKFINFEYDPKILIQHMS
ncbi:MAG: hypothetical protein Ct9H90mP7_3910 [Candidatus Neomarinimicrobiota bacterium]|nr:MAG: hypothetical protein Ct9H90mP7_3910 [Candidatus Neomarinimicrobiota bacterium]